MGGSPEVRYDSYMVPSSDQDNLTSRLLETDNRTPLPYNVVVRAIVRSADVLHSWALPSLGVKVDACPGRLNQQALIRYRPGLFYGQCSEICGTNHRFMPIVIELDGFTTKLKTFVWFIFLVMGKFGLSFKIFL